MSRDGILPPGVEHSDPHFWPPDEALCTCEHSQEDHDDPGGSCGAHDEHSDDPHALCPCQGFEPPGAY